MTMMEKLDDLRRQAITLHDGAAVARLTEAIDNMPISIAEAEYEPEPRTLYDAYTDIIEQAKNLLKYHDVRARTYAEQTVERLQAQRDFLSHEIAGIIV